MKKRSVANSASRKPREELTFFLDRQLGRYKMAAVLRAAGLQIAAAGRNNWVVVTRDERIRYRIAEAQAIRRWKVRAFVLVARGDFRAEALADIFLKALPKIRSIVAREKPPFIAKVWRDGSVGLL